MRFAIDTGGTFTDLALEDGVGGLSFYKTPTTPDDPVVGILEVLDLAARARGLSRRALLGSGSVLIHGTTHGLNAVLTGKTARTAFLTTEGHPDILLFREGGRARIFDLGIPYPDPYVPRSLTFEIPERVGSDGSVVRSLDESRARSVIETLRALEIEAVAVCFLWSIVNPVHELRIRELVTAMLPGAEVTLSHELNPCLREYRRASSACIDASLKPMMSRYIREVGERLRRAGFDGRLLIMTSAGSTLDADEVAAAPIHLLNSGPSMAPIAGRFFAATESRAETAIVADTGGTSYDVSVVRKGRIPWTREGWIGDRYFGHMTGFPSIDVRSVGAGGGSIAHVDDGGLLHVGPESAGAVPGPACYGSGGLRPTLTDACLLIGYLDAQNFLGGRKKLDVRAAHSALSSFVASRLHLQVLEAAAAVLKVATERMVSAIEEITVHQGIDPRGAVLIGGGGAAGLNVVAIARLLGCREAVVPSVGPVLSATGALMSDVARSFEATFATSDREFDFGGVNGVLARLRTRCEEFIERVGPGAPGAADGEIVLSVEARYPDQAWELECPLRLQQIETQQQVTQLVDDFHALHREVFSISDDRSPVEFISWHARAVCPVPVHSSEEAATHAGGPSTRDVYLPGIGLQEVPVWGVQSLEIDKPITGPAVIEAETTTIFVDPGAVLLRRRSGSVVVRADPTERVVSLATVTQKA